jgi:hypothetical protein
MKQSMWWALILTSIMPFTSTAQSLDWDDDRIAYGLSSDEHHPELIVTDEALQLLCDTGDGRIVSRFSTNGGLSWGAFNELRIAGHGTRLAGCTDGSNTFVATYDPGLNELWLYRFGSTRALEDSFLFARNDSVEVLSFDIATDRYFDPEDPYLNVVWLQRNLQTEVYEGVYCQSRDGGQSFSSPTIVFACEDDSYLLNNVVTTASWQGEEENIWVGATVDRLGSVPEIALLYRWIEDTETWESIIIDSSAYPQTDISVAGHESTMLAAYARRINASSQREIFFTYSLNGGTEFAEGTTITSSAEDDYSPRVVISPELNRFAVFYLTGDVQQEPATMWMREGELSAPWVLSVPVQISDTDQALRSGGYDVAAGPDGFAAAWSGPGFLGDTDIWFDASWLGESVQHDYSFSAVSFRMAAPYPNPFNSTVTVPFNLEREAVVDIEIRDILGREVMLQSFGNFPPGVHHLELDFSGLPSGVYYLRPRQFPLQIKQVQFVK